MYHRSGILFIIVLVLGAGLFFNCLTAMLNREDAYDRASTNQMFYANIVGMLIGGGLALGCLWVLAGGLWELLKP